jgi:hypothetical protein
MESERDEGNGGKLLQIDRCPESLERGRAIAPEMPIENFLSHPHPPVY